MSINKTAIVCGLALTMYHVPCTMYQTWAEDAAQPAASTAPPAPPAEVTLTVDEAVRHVSSADSLEREQGLYELGMLKSRDHLTQVTDALGDPHVHVQRAAVVALRLILVAEAVPQLESLARTARRPEVREQALHELQALQAAKALPTMTQAWRKDRQWRVRLAAVEALGATNDASAVAPLTQALRSRMPELRRSAAIALGDLKQLATPSVPELIRHVRGDADENVRVDAAEALRNIGDARAVPALLKTLNDPEDRVRIPAFKALEAWAQPGMEAQVAPYLNHGRPHERVYAAKILAKIGSPTALALLKARCARETHERVKPVLVDAIRAVEHHS